MIRSARGGGPPRFAGLRRALRKCSGAEAVRALRALFARGDSRARRASSASTAGEAARWMLHCHHMPHLAAGMMTEFQLTASA